MRSSLEVDGLCVGTVQGRLMTFVHPLARRSASHFDFRVVKEKGPCVTSLYFSNGECYSCHIVPLEALPLPPCRLRQVPPYDTPICGTIYEAKPEASVLCCAKDKEEHAEEHAVERMKFSGVHLKAI